MRAVRFHAYGPPEGLVVEEIPRPEPGPGEVLVRVVSAGVNPIDARCRSGLLRDVRPLSLPFVPGSDFAGVSEGTGEAVFGLARGSYAEWALSASTDIQPIPPGWDFDTAAAAPLGALTAWTALEDAGVGPGQRVLVQGAAGGVGQFLVQLAVDRGAEVSGTASAQNLDFVEVLGAARVFNYTGPGALPSDFDVVIDTVGGRVLDQSRGLVRPGGTLVSLAEMVPTETLPNGASIRYCRRAPGSNLGPLVARMEAKKMKAAIRGVYPLEQAGLVHRLVETGHGRGHFILRVSPPELRSDRRG